MSTPPPPHNPGQWGPGQNQSPGDQPWQSNQPSSQPGQSQNPTTGGWPQQGPEQPVTDNQVTYNADKFDGSDDSSSETTRYEQASQSESADPAGQPPQSDGHEAQPQSGGYDAQPQSGGYDAQPQSGTYAAQPQSGQWDQPATSYGTDPSTGSWNSSDTYNGSTATGAYGTATSTGSYQAQPGAQPAPWTGTDGSAKKSGSKKPLLIAGGALVVVAAVVIGLLVFTGFDGIRNSKGEISNAQAFLDSTKKQWEAELPTDGIEVSDKAACYYVVNDRDEITNEVACGPARRASTADGEVWDIYHFKVSGSGDKQTASEPGSVKVSQKAPSGDERLVNVDGDEPADDGLSIKEPPLPKADENGVWTSDSFVVDDKSKSGEADLGDDPRLVGPGADVTVDSVTEYSQAEIDGKLMQAAEGQKFVVVEMTGSSGSIDQSASNTVSFDLNGESVSTDLDPASMGTAQLMVSVPADDPYSLVLDSSGHEQSLDLTTGKRADDASTAQYYTDNPAPAVTLNQPIALPATASSVGDSFSASVTLTDASLQPYTDTDDWAPDGQVWLTINFQHAANIETPGSVYTQYTLDCMSSAVDGGTMQYCESLPGGAGSGQFVAAVPAGTTSVAVNLTFVLTAYADGAPDATVTYPASPVTITLS